MCYMTSLDLSSPFLNFFGRATGQILIAPPDTSRRTPVSIRWSPPFSRHDRLPAPYCGQGDRRMEIDTFKPTFLFQIEGQALATDTTEEITSL